MAGAPGPRAISDGVVRIGFVTDLSGPYEAVDGNAGVEAIRMAIADRGGRVAGRKVELVALDHRNDPALAAREARELFEERGVDVLIGGVNTDTSLAMLEVARDHRRPFLVVGAGSSRHTNEQCSPYVVQWAYDTTALSKVTANGIVRHGGRRWFFLTADYPFGRELESDTARTVRSAGATVVGSARHPHEETRFASYVAKARTSGADVLALASGHEALVGALRAAVSSGMNRTMSIAGLLVFIDEIHELGPQLAQGLYHADSWYWTRDAGTRAWSARFFRARGRMPSSLHAADYSAALQYLNAVEATGTDDPTTVLAKLRSGRLEDMYLRNGRIRGDGLLTHDMYLLRVRKPSTRSTEPSTRPKGFAAWDYDELVGTFSGSDAWRTRAQSRCVAWAGPASARTGP